MPAQAWLPIVVLAALSFALVLINGKGWLNLFIYTCACSGSRLPTVQAVLTAITLLLLTTLAGWLTGATLLDLLSPLELVSAVSIAVTGLARSIRTGQELRSARQEIARLAIMGERLRIARDLHDLLGHNLSLIALKSELARRLVDTAPERAICEIGDIEQVTRTTLQEVREAVTSYRQPTLENELYAAREILAAAGIDFQYRGSENLEETLPTMLEAVLAWTVREGVTNVIRHSRARHCTIRTARDAHDITIEIIDDGTGPATDTDNGGNGLRGLTERVTTLGGQCQASRNTNGGFRLAVTLPLAQKNYTAQTTPHTVTATAVGQATVGISEHTARDGERNEHR